MAAVFPPIATAVTDGLPDLVMADFEDVVIGVGMYGEEHVFRLEVENRGNAIAEPSHVNVQHYSIVDDYRFTTVSPTLNPGESAVLEFAWNSKLHVGDQTFDVRLDWGNRVKESNESNNAEMVTASAWIGGNTRLCGHVQAAEPADASDGLFELYPCYYFET